MEAHGRSWKVMEGQGRSWLVFSYNWIDSLGEKSYWWWWVVVACRIILSAPVPFPFLWTLDFRIWDLDLGLGFGTGKIRLQAWVMQDERACDSVARVSLLLLRGQNSYRDISPYGYYYSPLVLSNFWLVRSLVEWSHHWSMQIRIIGIHLRTERTLSDQWSPHSCISITRTQR